MRSPSFLVAVVLSCAAVVVDVAAASPDIVVLPFANYTGRHEAFVKILPALVDGLQDLGLEVVDHDTVRPVLRRHRIRSLGQLGRDDARILRRETGARLALLGSLDLYEPDTSLEVSLSARVLDLDTLELVRVVSVGLTVQETERWFATGRVADADAVIERVVEDVMDTLEPVLRSDRVAAVGHHTCGLVAVVPLDDHSESRYAAEILQTILMAELVEDGWNVVEPGFVREILLDHQKVVRGGVTNEVLDILRVELGVCWVVTGEIETFRVASGGTDAAVPALDFGLRLIDARIPRLVSALQLARDGLQGEGLFGRGREYSMARVARRCMEDAVRWIHRQGDK